MSLPILAAPTSPPAGHFIVDLSTIANKPVFSVSSGTVTTQFSLPYLTAGQCATVNAAGQVIGIACGGGSASIAITTGNAGGFTGIVSSPTAVVNFDSTTFNLALEGAATVYVLPNPSSVTLQGNNLSATYLTNSSATATYLQISSATATYLQSSSATATYIQISTTLAVAHGGTGTSTPGLVSGTNMGTLSGTWPNITINASSTLVTSTASVTVGHCAQWSAATGLIDSGAGCGSGGGGPTLIATQTWSGQNSWVTPAQSTFTYGLTVGSFTVNGSSAGQIGLTEGLVGGVSGLGANKDVFWADISSHAVSANFNSSASTYTIVTSSVSPIAGQFPIWLASGPNAWVVGSSVPPNNGGGGGTPANPPMSVQYNNAGSFGGSSNFQFNGTSITAISSVSISGNGSQNATPGMVDIKANNPNVGQVLFKVGSNLASGIFVPEEQAVDMTNYGLKSGALHVGDSLGTTRVESVNSPNYIDYDASGKMVLQTDSSNNSTNITLNPASTLEMTVSTNSIATVPLVTGSTFSFSSGTISKQLNVLGGNVFITTAAPSGAFANYGLNLYNTNTGLGDWWVPINFTNGAIGSSGWEFALKGGNSPAGFIFANNGTIMARVTNTLNASQFVETDANQSLLSYNLFGGTQTWTGQQAWTSAQPSTFTFAVNVGSITGGGLATCGDSTHGLAYTSTNTFACQSITGSGGGGGGGALGVSSGSATNSIVVSSPTSNIVFDSTTITVTLQGTTTSFVSLPNVMLLTSTQTNTAQKTWNAPSVFNGSATFNNVSSEIKKNVTQETATGISYTYIGSTMTISSMSISSLQGNQPGPINVTGPMVTSTINVTGGAIFPSGSHMFGKSNLNQWFSQLATLQSQNAPVSANKVSFFALGDSHMAENYIMSPFTDWLYSNFGNSGTYMPLSTFSEKDNTYRPNGCTYTIAGSTWITAPQQSTSLGLDNDTLHSSTPTATAVGTCPGADTVILHYKIQPNGGTIKFNVDGGAALTANTAGTVAVASLTVTGLTYGVHTASVSYTTFGTAGVDVLDFVFYSSSTPGAVMYRVGTFGQTLNQYVSQDGPTYQNLLAMLPSTPSVVMFEFGVNEEGSNVTPQTMITNAHTELGRFRAVYPNIGCAYFSPPVTATEGQYAFPMSAYETAWSSAAVNDGCAFIDFTAYFSSEPPFAAYYQGDGIHLDTRGGYVAGNTLINMFSNVPGNLTPFTFKVSSGVITYGNDQSTNTISTATIIGSNIAVSSGITNIGAIGANLTLTTSSVFLIGGQPGSGAEQNVKVSTLTAAALQVIGTNGVNATFGVNAATANFTAFNATATSATVTGTAGLNVSFGLVGSTLNLTAFNATTSSTTASGSGGEKVVFGLTAGSVTVITSTNSTYEATFSTAAAPFHLDISTTGHLNAPVVGGSTATTCGSAPSPILTGSDIAGSITVGGGSPTACTLTFGKPFTNTPVCLCGANGATACDATAASATSVTFTLGVTETTIRYICIGRD